jgi:bifunctional UDP-N-acetylglucosamine pyrophosphorylase/glucosamine-1-phosphate N-acetyltransferase
MVRKELAARSQKLSLRDRSMAIILAAGHGKRIKSETPKVAHPVWGVPSIVRISEAARKGLGAANQIIVVGIKAVDVARIVGKRPHVAFAYQEVQKGTGHAVQIAVNLIKKQRYRGNIYIFPGDAGLIDAKTIADFRRTFEHSDNDMMLLSGTYDGPRGANYYGRIVRVPRADVDGKSSREDFGNVIAIPQHKDILHLKAREEMVLAYRGRRYAFSKQQLLDTNEFDSGMFAFRADKLLKHLYTIKSDNVQGEIYLTDLVDIFNRADLTVGVYNAPDSDMLLGFNDKSTWKRMEDIARRQVYQRLKNIVVIDDDERFFIADGVVADIIRQDRLEGPLDMAIGADASIGPGVRFGKAVQLGENVRLEGNIILGDHVRLGAHTRISTYPDQTLTIGDHTEILGHCIIKGNTRIGQNTRIETGVNITGSDQHPVRIGDRCIIKGTTYIYGSIIEPDTWIEHSILVQSHLERVVKKDGSIQKVRFCYPMPEGADSIKRLG